MNRLAQETSPYLRQHADNPVEWWPWSDEAFDDARRRDVPVLLSIGYSACHWCHVMAHESFEDEAVAAVMNDLFVCIKVDREERPDVDSVYMEATQATTGSGGWPMTVFLDHDRRPFFAGTYFPKETGHGRPGFVEVMRAVDEAWKERRDDVTKQAAQITEAIAARSTMPAGDQPPELSTGPVEMAVRQLHAIHDREWGGFGRAPKFPQVSFLELLARRVDADTDLGLEEMLVRTLDAMASGGIYDHLGGGFARYSVDAFWMVPHFEKMLYDQAQLLRAYVHGYQRTGYERYRQVASEIVGYVERDLTSPEGGIYSAEDADSEGEEGKFYVWRPEEIAAALDGPEGRLTRAAIEWYGVTPAGNFEGSNILHRPVRADLIRPDDVEEARQRLLAARSERVRPGLDDKVLTEWNAMWVSALAEAAAALEEPTWLAAACRTAEFLLDSLRGEGGRWLRSWQGQRGAHKGLLAYAVDHAWLVDAFTRLAEATGQSRWVSEAEAAADALIDLFLDASGGPGQRRGLTTTGRDGEALIVRQHDTYDGATPSANGVAALALARLGALTGRQPYRETAEGIVGWLMPSLTHNPTAHTMSLAALDLMAGGVVEVCVAGDRPDLVAEVHRRFLPRAVLAWGEPFDSPLWQERDQPAAYVCRNYTCGLPATTSEALAAQLSEVSLGGPPE